MHTRVFYMQLTPQKKKRVFFMCYTVFLDLSSLPFHPLLLSLVSLALHCNP